MIGSGRRVFPIVIGQSFMGQDPKSVAQKSSQDKTPPLNSGLTGLEICVDPDPSPSYPLGKLGEIIYSSI